MRTHLLLPTALLLAGAAAAQNGPAAGSAANTPPANAPAANAPAANAPAPAPAAAGGKTVTVRVPTGGEYTAYVHEDATAAPKAVTDKADLALPALPKATIYVLDGKSGLAARKQVDTKAPGELSFNAPDFTLVQKVKVTALGKDDKPIAQGIVTLTDGGKNNLRKVIQPHSTGEVEFEFVKVGAGQVTVTAEDGNAVTQPATWGLAPGEQLQALTVSLPQVTATVEPAAGAAPPVAANAPAANAPAAAPTAAPALPAAPPAGSGGFLKDFIGLILLILVLGAAYVYLKNKGVTIESALKKLGVQPEMVASGGGSLDGANQAGGPVSPGAPPPPPPVVADPNQCPFCGQMKDPAGGCACTVTRGAPAPGLGAAPTGSGPRLVATGGTYLGQVFPLSGTAVIGRDAANGIALDRDTTASRRHAQISAEGAGFRIQDLGSSNGTFVNGARVTEVVLQPGDEVSIGGTRFRFEV
jgi:hypothetical protein